MKPTRILVTGAGGPAGINFVECLRMSKRPFHIVGADINRWHLELPRVDDRYVVPRADNDRYVPTLKRIIDREEIDVLHAQPDVEVEVISEHRDEFEARMFLPSKETIRICHDKMGTQTLLRSADVPVPRSHNVERIGDVSEIMARLSRNGSQVWLRAVRGAGSRAAIPVRTPRQAGDWIHYWSTMKDLRAADFMMAEFLPGREYAFQSLWRNGNIVTSACRMRLEYLFGHLTISGQSSSPSVAVTVHDEGVNRIATRAVKAVDSKATGVFCLDLKENADGRPCVTEINAGRFFTTSNFFARLGANMPLDLVRLALGERIPSRPKYNAVPPDCTWIRLVDARPTLVRGDRWRSQEILPAVRRRLDDNQALDSRDGSNRFE